MKVAIIGSAFSGNRGAAAMLESSIAHLTAQGDDVEITHLSMYPRSDADLNVHDNVEVMDASPLRLGVLINGGALLWRLLPPARDAIRKAVPEVGAIADADVLLDEGGITFVDGREKYLIYNVASILPALNTGTPVVKCAQALGPFENPVNRALAGIYLPKMAAIISRGAITHEHLMGLGLTNVTAGADMAFTLDITPEDREIAEASVPASFFAGGDVVGYSPSQVLRESAAKRGEDYVAEVVRHIDHLTEVMGRPVLLIAHSTRPNPDKLHNNDGPVCREILANVASPENVRFAEGELTPGALRVLIGQCDLFVASRFHAMVSSLAQGVPTLVLGWSHKYREVLDQVGQAEWAMAASDATVEAFEERMTDLDRAKQEIRAQLTTAVPAVRETAMEQFGIIRRVAREGRIGRAAKAAIKGYLSTPAPSER
ncbi:polysaccharide pyruvyl transferase family protein [Demequina sp. SYSU T00068]|uniref:polysaccharide pyruvyl transferase family protein n=1 Tax=Demequina lignilytica TaxID=3051663 RepID=UPI00261D9822|nr:polysaccharide pyruvyl transferase family protein [Demequina sp. SYSU T00068]MDN4490831.1 polysaccharide pyruvyl transferase family protein [Demequina sp. SYSU T00068]